MQRKRSVNCLLMEFGVQRNQVSATIDSGEEKSLFDATVGMLKQSQRFNWAEHWDKQAQEYKEWLRAKHKKERKDGEHLTERVQRNPSVNCSIAARNLRVNDLGKVILGCAWYTMRESLSKKIFDLQSVHFTYVKEIKPGLPLFLFNYSDRQLHGNYEAASNGEQSINPYAY